MKNEDVSAFVDGEIPAKDCAPLIDELSNDRAAQRTWSRYHLIGHVLRTPESQNMPPSHPQIVPLEPQKRKFSAPLAGLAIAASVAVATVLFVLRGEQPSAPPDFAVAEGVASRPLAPSQVASLTSAPVNNVVPVGAYDQRLNGYLVNFNEQRARLGVPGVHPYVRIVGFEAQ